MSEAKEFDQVAANAWKRSVLADRERELSSNLVADIWMGCEIASGFVDQAYEWIGIEKGLRSQMAHPTDDAEKAERVVRRIDNALPKNWKEKRVRVALSGLDILALKKIIVEPSGWTSGDVIAQCTQAKGFLRSAEEAYIESPYKYDPSRKGLIRRSIAAVKNGLSHKMEW